MKKALIGLTSTTIEIGLFIVIADYVTPLLFKLLLLLLLFGLMILFLVVVLLTPSGEVDTTASWSQWWMGACYPSLLIANWYSYFS